MIDENDDLKFTIDRSTFDVHRKKVLDLYYDCALIFDYDNPLDPLLFYDKMRYLEKRLNKYFMDELNKSL